MTATQQRYQPGGDIYARLAADYGTANANYIAGVAASGGDINAAIVRVKHGESLPESYWGILGNQLYNEPLNAPLEQAGTVLSNASQSAGAQVSKVARHWFTWVVALALGGYALWKLGGLKGIKRALA